MTQVNSGYFRTPSIGGDTVVFVCEDDLWAVDHQGGAARRLTHLEREVSDPAVSPDGKLVAFTGRHQHHPEVYVVPTEGGDPLRVTYLGAQSRVCGWHSDDRILLASDARTRAPGAPFLTFIYSVSPAGGEPEKLPVGKAWDITIGRGGTVIGRNSFWGPEAGGWKRYRGGLAGRLLIDRSGSGNFENLLSLDSNLSCPMSIEDRIFFISDHEGIGNIYSCAPDGSDIKRHTDHVEFYIRSAKSDGVRIVYQCAADVYLLDPARGEVSRLDIKLSEGSKRKALLGRRTVDSAQFIHGSSLDSTGQQVAIDARGRIFVASADGSNVSQIGKHDGVHYRLPRWLSDGEHLVVASDDGGQDQLEIFKLGKSTSQIGIDHPDIGRAIDIIPSTQGKDLAVINHRMQLLVIDGENQKVEVVDSAESEDIFSGLSTGGISEVAWSPDGRWMAYSCPVRSGGRSIKLFEMDSGRAHLVTTPDFKDFSPSFDPGGKYLFFLSRRVFEPVLDNIFLGLNFTKAVRPFLVTLRQDLKSPFGASDQGRLGANQNSSPERSGDVVVDVDGIGERVVAFPVQAARYVRLAAIESRIILLSWPAEPGVGQSLSQITLFGPPPNGTLHAFDIDSQSFNSLMEGVSDFGLSGDRSTLIAFSGSKFKILPVPESDADEEGAKSANDFFDFGRIELSIDPEAEFEQMFEETWRLQADNFWVEDLSGVDWGLVRKRYLSLLKRVATRDEFIDLLRDMQSELGTSHAGVVPGVDERAPLNHLAVGHLGADCERSETGRYRISHIVKGDSWDQVSNSPLSAPGINVSVGETILEVDGKALTKESTLGSLLVGKAGKAVELTVGNAKEENPRKVTISALPTETVARYREWVEGNRELVHEQSRNRIGYIHVPNMTLPGYVEFHRYWLSESDRDALILDFRYDLGGGIGSLMLEKLLRRPFGIAKLRWAKDFAYPFEGFAGPAVLLINEGTASNADIVAWGFRTLGLGPLVGTKTWGGVIGTTPRCRLVDGTGPRQPEQSFFVRDQGWSIENRGVEPDYEVEFRPQDYVSGIDPQLQKGVDVALDLLSNYSPLEPDLSTKPNLAPPKELPPRSRPSNS